METVYVGLDMGSSSFQQVAMNTNVSVRVNRSFTTSEANLRAAFADQHYLIEKKTAGGRTKTSVRRIVSRERTEEVARMLSGAKLTEASLRNAEQLIAENA